MNTDDLSHQGYLNAFERFLQTGEKESLAAYTGGQRPAAFLSVYRNGFIRASMGALESNFPSVKKLWGEEYFAQVASAYVNIAPPIAATLMGYGFADTEEGEYAETRLSFLDFLQQHAGDLQTFTSPSFCHGRAVFLKLQIGVVAKTKAQTSSARSPERVSTSSSCEEFVDSSFPVSLLSELMSAVISIPRSMDSSYLNWRVGVIRKLTC